MSAAPEPVDPAAPPGTPEISAAAQLARERLHEEIERVRDGVEEMLHEQENGNGSRHGLGPSGEDVRRELAKLRLETRTYVKRKVRKSEKKLERSVREIDARTDELEQRIDQVEADREEAEWRIHDNTEQMLDGLLDDIRSIADRLAKAPSGPPPAPAVAAAPAPAGIASTSRPAAPAAQPPPQAPVGRIGPRPLGRRNK
jgi:hypothetical protein